VLPHIRETPPELCHPSLPSRIGESYLFGCGGERHVNWVGGVWAEVKTRLCRVPVFVYTSGGDSFSLPRPLFFNQSCLLLVASCSMTLVHELDFQSVPHFSLDLFWPVLWKKSPHTSTLQEWAGCIRLHRKAVSGFRGVIQ